MGIATTTTTISGGDYRWLANARGTHHPKSGTLDYSAFSVTGGRIPSGTPVAYNSGTGLYGPAATTNTVDTLAGFVFHDTATNGTADLPTAILTDATVVAALVPGTHDLTDGRYLCDPTTVAGSAS